MLASSAAYIQELSDKNKCLWFADEFAQFLGQVEQIGSPLAQCKEYLLKTYDGNAIQRKTKLETIEIENPVLSILGVNTLDSYLKKISEESFTDGFAQRFAYLLAEPDEGRPFEQFPWFDEGLIQTELLKAFANIGNTPIHKNYVLSDDAFIAYEQAFQSLLKHEVSESFYRRLMFRSFKYMHIYHVIHGDVTPPNKEEQKIGPNLFEAGSEYEIKRLQRQEEVLQLRAYEKELIDVSMAIESQDASLIFPIQLRVPINGNLNEAGFKPSSRVVLKHLQATQATLPKMRFR